jgi:hypothetical protein
MRHYKTNKIYMGLRRHLPLLCVALGTLSFAGCSEFLDLKPLNEIVLENYWTEKADVENVVMSCYQGLETKDCITRMSVWGEMRSDNMTSGTGGDDEIVQLMKGNLLPSSSFSSLDRILSRSSTAATPCSTTRLRCRRKTPTTRKAN